MKKFFKFLIPALAVIVALTGCPTDSDDDIPDGIVMKTAIEGDVTIQVMGEDITINWGDGNTEDVGFKDVWYPAGNTYAEAKERTITITGKITHLDCSIIELTQLDVRAATELKVLYCYRNSLTSLDVSKNTALELLDCGDNPLLILDVSKNIKLESLECYNNSLSTLDVSKNTELDLLSFNKNSLTSIDLSKNTALTLLRCEENNLTSLEVSENIELKMINCSKNDMDEDALDALFESLPVRRSTDKGQIYIGGNDGADGCGVTIAEEKNWIVNN